MIDGLLTQALNRIITHPESWDQGDWFCGTKACLAGHICIEAGATPKCHTTSAMDDHSIVAYQDSMWTAPHLAEHLCGLTMWEGRWLWAADRTMPDLYEAVNRIERDLALYCWIPGQDEHIGPAWMDGDGFARIIQHRATTAEYDGDGWHRKDHPSRAGARSWASSLAHRHGLIPLTPARTEYHPS